MKKTYKNVAEIAEDLYAMLSYFKNDSSGNFNREANLIEKVRFSLNIKEDRIQAKTPNPLYQLGDVDGGLAEEAKQEDA